VTNDYLLLIVQFFGVKYCVKDLLRGTLFSVLVSNALRIVVRTRVGITDATKGNIEFTD